MDTRFTDRENIAAAWQRNLDMQKQLCAALESLADALPDQIDPQQCLHLARSIYPLLHRAHEFEESILFPFLAAAQSAPDSLPATLERLRFEHMEDESYAQEIFDALTSYVGGHSAEMAVTLSYMLRGLFDNLNRHIAFESEHLLPLFADKPA